MSWPNDAANNRTGHIAQRIPSRTPDDVNSMIDIISRVTVQSIRDVKSVYEDIYDTHNREEKDEH